jgi:endonuclease YncB( thermonuclease family)
MEYPFQYQPEHLAFGDKAKWVSATDGDTPTLELPLRMLGMDAPEYHYGGAGESKPDKFDGGMAAFLNGPGKSLDSELKKHLKKRLTSKSCTRQIRAGKAAFEHFEKIVGKRLDRGVGKNGKPLVPRRIFLMASTEVFDRYGRLLAYVNASYEKKEREEIPPKDRPTFNLQMMQDGHAVSLLIYPNVPKPEDLDLVRAAVEHARSTKRGFWEDGDKVLLAYEFRWIVDTIVGKRNGPDRYCADVIAARLYPPQQYYRVPPENRLFFYPKDVGKASAMGFTAAG